LKETFSQGNVFRINRYENAAASSDLFVAWENTADGLIKAFPLILEKPRNTDHGVRTIVLEVRKYGSDTVFRCFCNVSSPETFLPDRAVESVGHVGLDDLESMLRAHIVQTCVPEYVKLKQKMKNDFKAGTTRIPVSGPVIDSNDVAEIVNTALKGWFTAGEMNDKFEKSMSDYLGVKHVITTNSGSSAVLLAVASLTSPALGERRLVPGDEVVTVAAGFPTTVNPLLLFGLRPVFVDVDIPTYNVDPNALESAITPETRAILLPHTLGNPFNVEKVLDIATTNNLWVIEDACDALGSTFTFTDTTHSQNMVGTFGDIGAFSFFPAHHITMGEGGALVTKNDRLAEIIVSFRDWGRDCRCKPGQDNLCGNRFGFKWKNLPHGFDHKYVYSHPGFNLKITEMQAALGFSQLSRIDSFTLQRKENFSRLYEGLKSLQDFLLLPEATPGSSPSWFGFPVTVKHDSPVNRLEIVKFLENRKIGTRMLFAGNICRQPYFENINYRLGSTLNNTDTIMERTFWVGLQPALSNEMLDYIIESFSDCFREAGL